MRRVSLCLVVPFVLACGIVEPDGPTHSRRGHGYGSRRRDSGSRRGGAGVWVWHSPWRVHNRRLGVNKKVSKIHPFIPRLGWAGVCSLRVPSPETPHPLWDSQENRHLRKGLPFYGHEPNR